MTARPITPWTWLGLALAIFGIPVITTLHRMLVADPLASGGIVARELAILALTAFILWLVTAKERLPLSSIGLHTDRIGRSLIRGLLLAAVCLAAAVGTILVCRSVGIAYGEGPGISRAIPVTILMVMRAGIAEEVLYRGFAIERLQTLTGNKWIAAGVPLVLFALFHYRQGLAGIFIAFLLGAILTAFYLWKRDLLANIFGHFLTDFIPNVLLAPPA
ncbi:MAG TPA: CPBP family intramembrane glutamic endopeptidase [Sphingomicrobium sp.]|nr:CPBP family intramembrane glutamic endopeptidase [Sphingomicrobium sp.]